jgi:hypothetical protein
MAKTLSAHEQPIVKIFSDDYVFSIPDYQRPYSWTTEQAQELFDDLLGFVPANPGAIADMPSYFLGSIVLIKSDTPFADVVDGQQRLTTLTLLLSTIRSFASGDERAGLTEYIYEKGNRFAGTVDRFRLTLRERDKKFFQDYVQRDAGFVELLKLETGLDDSRRNLRDNARLFHDRLQAMSPQDRDNLTSFILQKCFLVPVTGLLSVVGQVLPPQTGQYVSAATPSEASVLEIRNQNLSQRNGTRRPFWDLRGHSVDRSPSNALPKTQPHTAMDAKRFFRTTT